MILSSSTNMMNRTRFIKTILLFVCICLVCSSCGREKDLGDDYIPGEDSQYMFHAQGLNTKIAATEDGYYLLIHNYIFYADKDTMKTTVLCNKPDCAHEKEMDPEKVLNCNAFMGSGFLHGFLSLYKDRLYVFSDYDNAQQKELPQLVSISLDGSNRQTEFLLPPETMSMTLHRGYFYYVQMDFSDGSVATSRIMLHKLGKSQTQEECIYTSELPDGKIQDLLCRGNQLYFEEYGELENMFVSREFCYNIISEKAKRILSEDDLIRPGYPKISSDRLYFELFQGGNNDYTDFLYHSTDLQGNDMREEFLAPSLDSSCLDQNYVYGCYPGTGPEDLPEIARVDFYDHSGNLKDSVEFPNARRTIRFAPGDDRYIFLQYDDDTYTYVDLIEKEIGSKNIKPISFFKMETSYINKGVLAKAS